MSKSTPAAEAAPLTLLQSFETLGMFAAREVKRDTVELAPDVTAEFYVRELPDAEFRKLWADGDRAKLIAACICDADGKAVMDAKKAGQLLPNIAAKLQAIALKHSGFGAENEAKAREEAGNG